MKKFTQLNEGFNAKWIGDFELHKDEFKKYLKDQFSSVFNSMEILVAYNYDVNHDFSHYVSKNVNVAVGFIPVFADLDVFLSKVTGAKELMHKIFNSSEVSVEQREVGKDKYFTLNFKVETEHFEKNDFVRSVMTVSKYNL